MTKLTKINKPLLDAAVREIEQLRASQGRSGGRSEYLDALDRHWPRVLDAIKQAVRA